MSGPHHPAGAGRLPPLDFLRVFEAAARHRHFAAAAAELGVTPSAVSHRIRALEEALGIALFRREGKGVGLTEAGRRLAPAVADGLASFHAGLDALRPTPLPGDPFVVSASPSVVVKWLVPHLDEFRAAYPAIPIAIRTDREVPDLGAGAAACAIHYGLGMVPGCLSVRLAGNQVAPMASPDFIARHGRIDSIRDLAGLTLLHDSGALEAESGLYDWARYLGAAGGGDTIDLRSGLHFDSSADVLNAAVAGAGVALGKTALARDDLATGRLRILFQPALDEPLAYFFVTSAGAGDDPRVAPFRDWLAERFGDAASSDPV
ncbi:LysR substrate-binding domain-containing protein [Oceanibacterium hippocampi]|uniref:Glycine cleavage system transcriptional activator n=1 Tax=Oceanibacterium hippocampi TaxID=745714 RepID=A0A1Y5TUW6_9PROT|nr:LysR substrate-binding domain-containing protein [Oceanibacterium hippocampi]SLN73682.1 Glycine cleavage system transcriptional activator [Oceanibacterium hippocampi]